MTCITVPHGFIELVEDPNVGRKRAWGQAYVIPDGVKSDFVYFVVHHIALSDEDMQALTEWAKERVEEIYTQARSNYDRNHRTLHRTDLPRRSLSR